MIARKRRRNSNLNCGVGARSSCDRTSKGPRECVSIAWASAPRHRIRQMSIDASVKISLLSVARGDTPADLVLRNAAHRQRLLRRDRSAPTSPSPAIASPASAGYRGREETVDLQRRVRRARLDRRPRPHREQPVRARAVRRGGRAARRDDGRHRPARDRQRRRRRGRALHGRRRARLAAARHRSWRRAASPRPTWRPAARRSTADDLAPAARATASCTAWRR